MQASVPGLGGTTSTTPLRPRTIALGENDPPRARRMITVSTGPWSPPGSPYLKPSTGTLDQNGFPSLRVPWGSTNLCVLGLAPLAKISRTAPPTSPGTVGLPTIVLVLPFSFAEPMIERFEWSMPLGSLTSNDLPSTVCTATRVPLTLPESRTHGWLGVPITRTEKEPVNVRSSGLTVPSTVLRPGSPGSVHSSDGTR